jgi:hypothetical protein
LNIVVVQHALGELDRILSSAKSALRQIEAETFNFRFDGDGSYEEPLFALESHLEELHDLLMVVLEAAEMPETRASLVKSWSEFTAQKHALRKTIDNFQFESCDSPALTFLQRMVQGLRISVAGETSSEEAWTLNKLEDMLWDTPRLVHGRNQRPKNEKELQRVMHDYLRAAFPDFTSKPQIGGTLKNFKPDCGIASAGAAIEFKIVHNKDQVAVAFSGIAEDSAGYKGSKDWTRFYAVLYQAQPFMSRSHVRSDMKRIGATTWTPILVNGPTGRKPRKVKPARSGRKGRTANTIRPPRKPKAT